MVRDWCKQYPSGKVGRVKINVSDSKCLAFLLLVQAVMFLVVQPSGDFPLNDDWAYSHSVEWLLSEGRIRLSDWIAPNLLPQTLLGGSVASIAGFSFETLRHLTQVLALLTSIAIYYWFRSGRLSSTESLLASLVVISMPSWPILANSYMTDIYGLFFAIVGSTLLLQSLDKPSASRIFIATAVISVGMLQRQVMLVIPFAFLLAWFWKHTKWTPWILFLGLIPLLVTIVTELLYFEYLSSGPGVPNAQKISNERLLPFLLWAIHGEHHRRYELVFNVMTMISYLGLFMAAWATWWGVQAKIWQHRLIWPGLILLVVAVTLGNGWLPPYLANNTIDGAGIGPFTIYDGLPRDLVQYQRQAGFIWPMAGVVAAFGITAIITLVMKSIQHLWRGRRQADPRIVFILTIIAAYSAPFIVTAFFDRYLLFLLPFIILLWSLLWPNRENLKTPKLQQAMALSWIAVALFLSSIATHDYFAWNRARWDAIRFAESIGGSPATIDGGFEYNGYYQFGQQTSEGKSWWWVNDDEYVVTFTEVPGYELLRTFPVQRFSSRTQPSILLMQRDSSEKK